MKVGDIVRQQDNNDVIRLKGMPVSSTLGVVVKIHDHEFPDSVPEQTRNLIKRLGRKVDVMWASGKLTPSFAENALEVVVEERN
ncbi:MAG TPA: hypothetical protein EYQ00_11225 [Dehalococcoidia bacterium]|nr:hypothetical protein [Dehalococcoidia bacterium]